MKVRGANVFTAAHIFEQKDICISGEMISDMAEDYEILDAAGLYAIPGLVDIHFHGAVGHDLCDADLEGLKEIAAYEAKHGVTAICPATMTYREETLNAVMDTARAFVSERQAADDLGQTMADMAGINMEGPFISPKQIGAQNPNYLCAPDVGMFQRLQKRSGHLIKLVAVAPEVDGAMEFIEACREEVTLSLAHSRADYDTACRAFSNGVKHVTHLYNAMPGMHHRQPGPVIAALEHGAQVELIADGIHVHPAMVRFTFRAFPKDKVILISDSMEAAGLPEGRYQLGSQDVTVSDGRAVLTNDPGTIAGSVKNLYDCFRHAVKEMHVPMEEAVCAATENPARAIGADDKYGSLLPGRYANIVLFDEDMEIRHVICHGKIIR